MSDNVLAFLIAYGILQIVGIVLGICLKAIYKENIVYLFKGTPTPMYGKIICILIFVVSFPLVYVIAIILMGIKLLLTKIKNRKNKIKQ